MVVVFKRNDILRKQLEKEQEIIAKWKDSSNVFENMCSTQILEENSKKSWNRKIKILGETDHLTSFC